MKIKKTKQKKKKFTLWCKSKLKKVDKEKILTDFFVKFLVGLALMIVKYYFFSI